MSPTNRPSPVAAIQQSIRSLHAQLAVLQESLAGLEVPRESEPRDLIYDLDPDGVVEPASSAARRLHGAERMLVSDLVHRVHLADLRIMLETSLSSPSAPEQLLRSAWGETLWASITRRPGDGSARRLLLRPVAGHPELIQALNQPAGQLSSLKTATMAVGPRGRILDANGAARRLLGMGGRDILPLYLNDILNSNSPSIGVLCTDYGPAVRVEATVVRSPADGTWLWLIARFDQPDRIVVVLREREPAHQAPELEPVLADAARGSAFALFATDHDGQITVAVGQALADFGIDDQQVLGTSVAALPFPGVGAAVRRAPVGQSSAGTWQAHSIPFDCRFAPTYDAGGRVDGSSIIAFDVAAQRDEERSGRGRETADVIARLSAVVADSLNGALAVIQCHSDLAHAEVGHDGAADQHLNAIDGAVRDAGELAAQLRATAGAPVAHPEHVELTALLAEAGDALRSHLRVILHASVIVPAGIMVTAQPSSLLEGITLLGQWIHEGGASALCLELWSGSVDEDQARWLGLPKPGRYARVTLRNIDQPMAEERVVGPEPFGWLGDGAQLSLWLLSADGLLRANGARLRVLDRTGAQIYLPLAS